MPQTNALQRGGRELKGIKRLIPLFLVFASIGGWYFYPMNKVLAYSAPFPLPYTTEGKTFTDYVEFQSSNCAGTFAGMYYSGGINPVKYNDGSNNWIRLSPSNGGVQGNLFWCVGVFGSSWTYYTGAGMSQLFSPYGEHSSQDYLSWPNTSVPNCGIYNANGCSIYTVADIAGGSSAYYLTNFTTFSPANASTTGNGVTFSQSYTMNSTSSPYDVIGIEAWYESQNWKQIFNATTTMSAGANSFETTITLQNNQAVNWRAYMYSSSTESTEIYLTDMHYFTVGSNPYPSMFGTTTENIYQLATSTCGITNISGCFQNAIVWAFYPSQGSLAQFVTLKDEVIKKPPFGYFALISTTLNTLSAEGVPLFSLATSTGVMTNIFTPLRTGLSMAIWLLFGVWCIKTFSHLNI